MSYFFFTLLVLVCHPSWLSPNKTKEIKRHTEGSIEEEEECLFSYQKAYEWHCHKTKQFWLSYIGTIHVILQNNIIQIYGSGS